MSDDPLDIDIDDLQRRMNGAMASLKTEFASLRTGRASGSILDPVMVDAYGQMTPINQVGTVNVPESRMVTVNVWDKTLVGKVEKAIRESGLGINPQTERHYYHAANPGTERRAASGVNKSGGGLRRALPGVRAQYPPGWHGSDQKGQGGGYAGG
jgi:ribosome recycling factor